MTFNNFCLSDMLKDVMGNFLYSLFYAYIVKIPIRSTCYMAICFSFIISLICGLLKLLIIEEISLRAT